MGWKQMQPGNKNIGNIAIVVSAPRREGKCCRSYVSGVTVTPNDIFADCSQKNEGKVSSSDDDDDDDGSGCNKRCREQKKNQWR